MVGVALIRKVIRLNVEKSKKLIFFVDLAYFFSAGVVRSCRDGSKRVAAQTVL